ncbi:hypothetical protein PKB_0252 [Pseudomonas knackmussii B13]|uniref:CobW C-terminal domain-containing protein n=1 Tax=Pseudomonas knackmussii (strain DSM 6978 / CCUG 54928 / LMG 23759 / B13) TaxID=1301098 RepID=A0A024HA04_PSEKB|nr:CobW family GTP-binding protein [Pseudomonas knackmussii]CDF81631.1 hypothetical protein PKB_0252 [Pseudomonas knackmussii B13]
MLEQIPTHVIGGPLGAGKTSLIRDLLRQRPEGERWAVLVNEFGQVGLDAALLSTDADGVALGEVAGGCLCCVNGAPFQVGLARLLRKARPQRLFIEPSGLGHPRTLLRQLGEAPWRGVLAPQPLLLVLDAQALAAGQALPEAQREALADAELLVLNKSEGLDDATKARIRAGLPEVAVRWTEQGHVPLQALPSRAVDAAIAAELPAAMNEIPVLLTRETPIRQVHVEDGRSAVGWRLHRDCRFHRDAVDNWLASLGDLVRAKAVLHCAEGWLSCNRVSGDEAWQPSAWRKDNRVELIFATDADPDALEAGLLACLQTPE